MIISAQALAIAFTGFKSLYNGAFDAAPSDLDRIAMTAPSNASEEVYGWMGQFPGLREWVGERLVKNLSTHGFSIKNRKFESTVSIPREKLEDDQIGVFAPLFKEMGRSAKIHPDTVVFELLKTGFAAKGYDGQYFFDAAHPGFEQNGEDLNEVSVSNMQAGSGEAWYLLDTSRAVKPVIWQPRTLYEFQTQEEATSQNVFLKDEYMYGVRARGNAGFGLWQLAFASKAELNAENYELARNAMQKFTGDQGQKLGITPTLLVVPTTLEGAGRRLLKADKIGEETNIWKDTAELLVTPWL